MTEPQAFLYDSILSRIKMRGDSLGKILAKHTKPKYEQWLIENEHEEPRLFRKKPDTVLPKEVLLGLCSCMNVKTCTNCCWDFLGFCNPYGQVFIRRSPVRAHVLIHSLWDGLPDNYGKIGGLTVRHTCDNPKCCNPHHLIDGTVKQNVNDKFERGRAKRHEKYGATMTCPICKTKFIYNRSKHGEIFCSRRCYLTSRISSFAPNHENLQP